MQWILNLLMSPELALHVAVAQQAHLGLEFFAVHAQNAPVELQRRKEGQGLAEAGLGAHCGGRGHEAEGGAHVVVCLCLV